MKRFKILLAALLLCLSLCACQSGKSADEPATEAATQAATEASDEPQAGSAVTTGKEETFSYTDKSGREINAVYRLPSLRFNTPDAQKINSEIETKFAPLFDEAAKQESAQTALSVTSLDYDAAENDDIVSVVIKTETGSHVMKYAVYNYNTATGSRIYNADLLGYLQLDYDQTFASLQKSLEEDYTTKFKPESFPDDYYYQLDRSTGEEAIRESQLFLNEDGILYAVCTEYATVGAGEFEVLLKV